MPRKIKADQAGRFALNKRHRRQWPLPHIWGSGPGAERALERWVARHDCDGTCEGPGSCGQYRLMTRLRTMYARRRR